jgi:hypothetical protein
MGESLTEQSRVSEEGLRVVKLFRQGRIKASGNGCLMTVPAEEAPTNYVPAVAVIRKVQTLFGITGRKGYVGG